MVKTELVDDQHLIRWTMREVSDRQAVRLCEAVRERGKMCYASAAVPLSKCVWLCAWKRQARVSASALLVQNCHRLRRLWDLQTIGVDILRHGRVRRAQRVS